MVEHYDYSKQIWQMKHAIPGEMNVEDTWNRLAVTLSSGDTELARKFFSLLYGFKFLPGGRIQANIGSNRKRATAMNCYVGENIHDSMEGICASFTQSMLTLRSGGGLGTAWHTLRPGGDPVTGVEGTASGPLSFMKFWDTGGQVVSSAGQRRGAQLASQRIDHPDVEAYITAKERNPKIDALKEFLQQLPHLSPDQRVYFAGTADGRIQGILEDAKRFTRFNISIAITNDFMHQVEVDGDFDLKFDGRVYKTIKARHLWDMILRHTYESNDPGILFIDRINELNNLWYCEEMFTTNPCGEQPLPQWGTCLLGSQNLSQFVQDPFLYSCSFDMAGFRDSVRVAVHFLERVIDESFYPLEEQREQQQKKRRQGQGITAVADLFAMMRVLYGGKQSQELLSDILWNMVDEAYNASVDLAQSLGPFPLFDADKYCQSKFLKNAYRDHPQEYAELIARIREYGIRHSHLLSIAPTGTISFAANNVNSGIEPFFFIEGMRAVVESEGIRRNVLVQNYAWRLLQESKEAVGHMQSSEAEELLRAYESAEEFFVNVDALEVDHHYSILEVASRYCDSAVSKTMNLPYDYPYEKFVKLYERAFHSGTIKGCTTYRIGTGKAVLMANPKYPIVELPEKLPGETYVRRANGTRWYIHINFLGGKPIQVFAHTNHTDKSHVANRALHALGLFLHSRGVPEEEIDSMADKSQTKAEQLTRWISLGLRYGISHGEICDVIDSTKVTVDTLPWQLSHCLRSCASSGGASSTVGDVCTECKSATVIYQEGCKICTTCGHSFC